MSFSNEQFKENWNKFRNFVICKDALPIGFLSYILDTHSLYIRDMHICAPERTKGYGTKIMNQLFDIAEINKCTQMRLRVFGDTQAVFFYKRFGFEIVRNEGSIVGMEVIVAV